MATVPAKAPSPKIYVAIRADTRVGMVRRIENNNLTIQFMTLLFTMLFEAKKAKGIAKTAPKKDPKKDIFIVSKSGPTTEGK